MPRRNLMIILIAAAVSLMCYDKAARNPYSAVFNQALHLVVDHYVEPVDSRELFEGAMDGMMSRLDEHSAYIPPQRYEEFAVAIDQEFGGIGIVVSEDRESGVLVVMSPLIGTPAYEAGILAGDMILAIDGVDARGLRISDSVKLLRGAPGEPVRLTVLHLGQEKPVTLTMERAVIEIESALGDTRDPGGDWNFTLEVEPRIAYIRLTTFGEQSAAELEAALEQSEDAAALILDLRDNAGGLLTAAIEICDLFIDTGLIVTTRGRDGEIIEEASAHRRGTLWPADKPMVILVNELTASAGEIVAACLQDHGRAVIIGRRTWGKGTVQNLIPLEGGKSRLKLTTASYWRPSGRNIHRTSDATEEDDWGVRPNNGFEVELSEEELEQRLRRRRQRDVVRFASDGKSIAPHGDNGEDGLPSPSNASDSDNGDSPQENRPDDAEPEKGERNHDPYNDPQLQRAIEFLLPKINRRPLAA